MKKQRKALFAIGAGAGIVAIGATIAYNSDIMSFANLFKVGSSEVVYTEQFASPENWQPCQPVDKTFTVTNKSSEPVAVRFKINEYWRVKNSTISDDDHSTTELSLTWNDNGTTKPLVNIIPDTEHQSDWTYNPDDGWYYYNTDLAAGATTSSYLSQVMIDCNANLVGDVTYSADGKTGTTGNSRYNNAKYHLFITGQTIAADHKSDWISSSYETMSGHNFAKKGSNWGPFVEYFTEARTNSVTKIQNATSLPENAKIMVNAANYTSEELAALPSNYTAITNSNKADANDNNAVLKIDTGNTAGGIFAWIDTSTGAYNFYSESTIKANNDMGWIFDGFTNLADISALGTWNWSNTSVLQYTFRNTAISDISALSALSASPRIKNLAGTFLGCQNLSDISVLSQWNVKIGNKIGRDGEGSLMGTFQGTNIDTVAPLANWDMSEAADISYAFANTRVTDSTPLASWNTQNVKRMQYIFAQGSIGDRVGARLNNYTFNNAGIVNWNLSSMACRNQEYCNGEKVNWDAYYRMFYNQNGTTSGKPTTGSWTRGTWDSEGTYVVDR